MSWTTPQSAENVARLPRTDVTGWALRAIVAVVFVVFGTEKFPNRADSMWVQLFGHIGLGQWFRYFTGVLEAGGGLLMLVPRATIVAAAILACTMLGAMAAHIFVLADPGSSIIPAALLAGVVGIAAKLRTAPDTPTRLQL